MPVMLLAIVLGLILHKIDSIEIFKSGVHWTSRSLLYFGVALMGLRIDFGDISLTGWEAPLLVVAILGATLLFGYVISRLMQQSKNFSLLIGGAVAICGVSAAVAMSSAMRESKNGRCELAVVIAGVTFLSTVAMILYPLISMSLELGSLSSGIFLGGAIHNVSQAVGAGYSISHEAGDITVLLKLVRVTALLPIVVLVSILNGQNINREGQSTPHKILSYFPPFLLTFFVLAVLSCLNLIPDLITHSGNIIAELCLVISLVAIGIRTEIRDVLSVGLKPFLSLTLTTIFMAGIALIGALSFPMN